jgi:ATP synthase protein I
MLRDVEPFDGARPGRWFSMSDSRDPTGDDALRARLTALSGAIEAKRQEEAKKRAEPGAVDALAGAGFAKAVNVGLRVLSEFVAGIIAGGLIGWQLDRWFGISPVMLILFTMAGTAAGFWNVYRIAARPTAMTQDGQARKPGP